MELPLETYGLGLQDADGRWIYIDPTTEASLPMIFEGETVGTFNRAEDSWSAQLPDKIQAQLNAGDLLLSRRYSFTDFTSDDGPAVVVKTVAMSFRYAGNPIDVNPL